MTISSSKAEFLKSEKAELLRGELQKMVDDPRYNTKLRYSLVETDESYFVTKHMDYMSAHLKMDHNQYISNLKLMTKVPDAKR